MKTRRGALATAAVLAFTLVACGGGGGSSADADTDADADAESDEPGDATAATEEATTTTLSPEDAVWNDVVSGSDALSEISATPDPEHPELLRYFTGESLAGLQDAMRDLQAGGAADTSAELHRYSVTVAGETATVDYCFVDTTQRLTTTGEAIGEPEVTAIRSTAQLELIDDVWKMAQQTFTPEECPAS